MALDDLNSLNDLSEEDLASIALARKQKQQERALLMQQENPSFGQTLADFAVGFGEGMQGRSPVDAIQKLQGGRREQQLNRLKAMQGEDALGIKELNAVANLRKKSEPSASDNLDAMSKGYELKKDASGKWVPVQSDKAIETARLIAESKKVKDPVAQELLQARLDQIKEGKDPTVPQYQAAGFAKRMELSENELKGLVNSGFDPASNSVAYQSKYIPAFAEGLKPQATKAYEQIKRNFISAILRKESGAAISQSEFDNEEKKYFPQAGESAEVQQQKAIARQQALNNLKAEGSRAYGKIATAEPSRSGSQLQENTKVIGGVTYKKVDGGWQAVEQ